MHVDYVYSVHITCLKKTKKIMKRNIFMLDFIQNKRIKLLIMIAFRSRSCCFLVETGKSIMEENQTKIQ